MRKGLFTLVGGLWITGALIIAISVSNGWWLLNIFHIILYGAILGLPGIILLFFAFKNDQPREEAKKELKKGLPILLGILLTAPIIIFLAFLILMGLGSAGILLW